MKELIFIPKLSHWIRPCVVFFSSFSQALFISAVAFSDTFWVVHIPMSVCGGGSHTHLGFPFYFLCQSFTFCCFWVHWLLTCFAYSILSTHGISHPIPPAFLSSRILSQILNFPPSSSFCPQFLGRIFSLLYTVSLPYILSLAYITSSQTDIHCTLKFLRFSSGGADSACPCFKINRDFAPL